MNGLQFHPTLLAFVLSATALLAGDPKELPAFGGDVHKYWNDACARCHGANGNGRDAAGKPLPDAGFDFTDSRKANRKKDEFWIRDIQNGHEKMPSFKGKLSEAETQKMITEVLRKFAAK
jgi:mono/diheme cytochrome c family protein